MTLAFATLAVGDQVAWVRGYSHVGPWRANDD